MALPGFRGTTYEVLTGDGSRWVIAQIFRVEKEARGLASKLLASGDHALVRITAKRDGRAAEKIIFEEAGRVSAKIFKPFQVAAAPVCESLGDCLRHEARLAIGRVGRAYLDEGGITPAEFLVSAADLITVERHDPFFFNAVHVLAKAQAGATDKSAADRAETLFDLYEQLRDQAREHAGAGEKLRKALAKQGLAALPMDESDAPPPFAILSCLAEILAEGGSWPGRLSKMLDLLESGGGSAAARALVDELIAEILDGAQAISEVMGGLRGAGEACTNLSMLATGTGRLPKYASDGAHRLHALMTKAPLPATQTVLLERVARVLASVKPLTDDGGQAERDAFTALVPTLLDPAGTLGGGTTAEALTLRSKMALGSDEELTMAAAIKALLDLFPTRAVRLGYLLDLTPTPTGQKNTGTIRGALLQLIEQLRTVRDLMPEGTPHEILLAAIHSLRARLLMDTLPEDLRGALTSSLTHLLTGDAPQPRAAEPAPKKAEPAPRTKPKRREVDGGEILFEEGDEGHEAYLISEGMVDVYRVRDGREEILATLGRGEIIGEMSLIDDRPRAASARTRAGTSLVVISQDDMKKRMAGLDKSDRLLKLLMDTLVRRLRGQAKD
ncbi:MAG: cyclic nucleotide-binding domain-containing protein [Rhodospirillales bacterium]|nr:cyclic nucleotide-binding domain-containing protein [Rhodospirillales bacterium]